jgi:hypothetical protein
MTRFLKLVGSHWLEMAGLSLHDEAVRRSAAHGKEGVNGSSPLEGFVVFGVVERDVGAWLARVSG